jgi:hypothetical protein
MKDECKVNYLPDDKRALPPDGKVPRHGADALKSPGKAQYPKETKKE